jgi:uroporphyrinogen III methyltransferase/synthase
MKPGKVFLVGAGPGDPGLITQKGLERLKAADVIVFDRLLDESLLESARPDVEKIYVGKASSDHTMVQSEINRLLVKKALAGKNVVRLKGGDPFVFGRGGEEAEELLKNKIEFEIIPGITSAISVPAYAGIPVTHRGVASSFAVITGHEVPGKTESSINWANLATGVDTLVFLMGLQNLPEIVNKLLENGRAQDVPVAVIKDGTRPQQVAVTGTLNDIVARVKESKLTSPAIILVGEVVNLRKTLSWFDNRPLFGKRILVTRSRQQASALSKLLAERGAQPVELPAISIESIKDNQPLKLAISNLAHYQWVIFTSVNGVSAFFESFGELNLDSRALGGTKIGAIGPATAGALECHGIKADFQPEVFTSECIIKGLGKLKISGQNILLPRADIADDVLVKDLIQLGARPEEVIAYRTSPAVEAISKAKEMLSSGKIDVITFASSSTVSSLISALGSKKAALKKIKVASIGPKTSETAVKAGLKVDIEASQQTLPGLVSAIEDYFRKGGK